MAEYDGSHVLKAMEPAARALAAFITEEEKGQEGSEGGRKRK